MAIGSASLAVAGPLEVNAAQSAANAATVPQAILDDPINGSICLHLGGRGTAPTVAVHANAGTGAAATLDTNATDLSHQLTITTGSGSYTVGTVCTVTLGTAHVTVNRPMLTPGNAAAITNTLGFYINSTPATLGTYTIAAAVVPTNATTFVFNVGVLGA